jgi:hypothetical protein
MRGIYRVLVSTELQTDNEIAIVKCLIQESQWQSFEKSTSSMEVGMSNMRVKYAYFFV